MKILLAAVILVLASGASFFAGTRIGITSFSEAEAQYKASVTAGELRMLEQQRLDVLKQVKEVDLNGLLAQHGRYMDSNFKWLWPGLKSDDDRAIRSAVKYRASHPFEDPDLSKAESWKEGVDLNSSFVQDIVAGQTEHDAQIKKVLETYSP